jgi:hypothetical protein
VGQKLNPLEIIRISLAFRSFDDKLSFWSLPRYKKKGSWISKPNKNTTLESFIDLVTNDVQRAASTNIPTHNNLTPAEKGAIQKLKERDNIGIKPADKCSSVVVMDKVDYLEEANRQLTDERFYKKLDTDPTEEFSTKETQELKIMKENSHRNKNGRRKF